jgi:hypothetical protein
VHDWEHAGERVQLGRRYIRQKLRQVRGEDGICALQQSLPRFGQRHVLAAAVRQRLVALDPACFDQGREQLRDRWAGHARAPGELGRREVLVDARPVRDGA